MNVPKPRNLIAKTYKSWPREDCPGNRLLDTSMAEQGLGLSAEQEPSLKSYVIPLPLLSSVRVGRILISLSYP